MSTGDGGARAARDRGARAARDRDPEGRARNARPRDGLGRPLPYGSPGQERVPEDRTFTPDEAIVEAQRLLDAGMPFHAHEVFEAVWKDPATVDRELWQGLAQFAVGLTHVARGNATGARSLLGRAARQLHAPRLDERPFGLDPVRLATIADQIADVVDESGTDAVPAALSRPRLRQP